MLRAHPLRRGGGGTWWEGGEGEPSSVPLSLELPIQLRSVAAPCVSVPWDLTVRPVRACGLKAQPAILSELHCILGAPGCVLERKAASVHFHQKKEPPPTPLHGA